MTIGGTAVVDGGGGRTKVPSPMGKDDAAAASPTALWGPTGSMGAGAADTPGGKGPRGANDGRHDELPLIVQGLLSLRSPSVTTGAAGNGAGGEAPGDATKTRPGARFGAAVLKEDSDGGSTMSVAGSDGEARVKPLSPPEGLQPATTLDAAIPPPPSLTAPQMEPTSIARPSGFPPQHSISFFPAPAHPHARPVAVPAPPHVRPYGGGPFPPRMVMVSMHQGPAHGGHNGYGGYAPIHQGPPPPPTQHDPPLYPVGPPGPPPPGDHDHRRSPPPACTCPDCGTRGQAAPSWSLPPPPRGSSATMYVQPQQQKQQEMGPNWASPHFPTGAPSGGGPYVFVGDASARASSSGSSSAMFRPSSSAPGDSFPRHGPHGGHTPPVPAGFLPVPFHHQQHQHQQHQHQQQAFGGGGAQTAAPMGAASGGGGGGGFMPHQQHAMPYQPHSQPVRALAPTMAMQQQQPQQGPSAHGGPHRSGPAPQFLPPMATTGNLRVGIKRPFQQQPQPQQWQREHVGAAESPSPPPPPSLSSISGSSGHSTGLGSASASGQLAECEQESLAQFREQTQKPILVSIPADSAGLDPGAVIASDPAEAHRVAVAATVSAGVDPEEAEAAVAEAAEAVDAAGGAGLLIQQQVPLVPSQIPAAVVLTQNQESRIKNLEKIPVLVVVALEAKLSSIPAWGVRITKEKLEVLGGITSLNSSPVLMEGERPLNVTGYAPKNHHLTCKHCNKAFSGKNALRNFELHAIFWELYAAHPAVLQAMPDLQRLRLQQQQQQQGQEAGKGNDDSTPPGGVEMTGAMRAAEQVLGAHQVNYPCNSVSRDVVLFMEAKKIFKLHGNLHHDTSLFQGRAWLRIPAGKTWESCRLADPNSLQEVLWCRGKTLEAYETLRNHVFAWHDAGVFTNCTPCNRVYQNTRAFLAHGCAKRGGGLDGGMAGPGAMDGGGGAGSLGGAAGAVGGTREKDEMVVANCSQSLMTLLDNSPDFAKVFYQLQRLPTQRKEDVFDRVAKRLRSGT